MSDFGLLVSLIEFFFEDRTKAVKNALDLKMLAEWGRRALTHVNSCTSAYPPRLNILSDTTVPMVPVSVPPAPQVMALKAGYLYALY